VPLLSLPIVHARQETPRTRVIRLGLQGQSPAFEAGQYMLLGQHGLDERRPYSIALAPAEASRRGVLEFLLQVGADGSPGTHLPRLDVGVMIDAEGPEGNFTMPTGRLGSAVLLVAGGTGIAPLRAMLWQLLESSAPPRVGLVHSGRNPDELAYAGEFRALAQAGRIRLVETVTRDAPETWQGIRGRIGRAQLEAAMPGARPLCFVCGPDSLIEDVPRLLTHLGVPASQVFTEHWVDQAARELKTSD
jgi:ferredoxin-NADP reductase